MSRSSPEAPFSKGTKRRRKVKRVEVERFMSKSFGKAEKAVKLEEGERYDFGNVGAPFNMLLLRLGFGFISKPI